MEVLYTRSALFEFLKKSQKGNMTIGLVPTMGALHEGHLVLIAESRANNDLTICSIYVNPRQFNNKSDLEKYPRDATADIQKLEGAGCDILFQPSDPEMYPEVPLMGIEVGPIGNILEGKVRPGHFEGMALIVTKLFNIIRPDRAYFGQKDLQQLRIIQKMVTDLSYPIEIIPCPIVREQDGLALSSRNMRLSPVAREAAPLIYQSLSKVKHSVREGIMLSKAVDMAREDLDSNPMIRTEYIEPCHAYTLQPMSEPQPGDDVVICVAAFVGEVRLIDNLSFIY